MQIERISVSNFESENSPKIFFGEDTRVFGRVTGTFDPILISWNSDLIEPSIVVMENNLIIGVDQKIGVYHLVHKTLVMLLPLSSRFFSFVLRDTVVVVVAELEIAVLSTYDFSVVKIIHLPDIVEDYEENQVGIKVFCMDGKSFDIAL